MTENNTTGVTMEKIVSLCKRRGFVFPSSEIYGGFANAWDFGPYGAQMKKNIKDHWWKFFVEQREDIVGLDAAIIMNPKVWEASGHLSDFSDFLTECRDCHTRVRADHLLSSEDNTRFFEKMHSINEDIRIGKKPASDFDGEVNAIRLEMQKQLNSYAICPNEKCKKKDWTEPGLFNLMLQTALGPVRTTEALAYFRPETAQAMFVDLINIANMSRKKLPFGIAQIGKAFRNEITPGNFIFRTREFEQMEIEYFFDPNKTDWQKSFEEWKEAIESWMLAIGIDVKKTHAVDIPEAERAHYSKRTIDFEFEYPFGQKELFGLAYRGDYDLSRHEETSGQELRIIDPETNEKIRPHVIEPSLGVERAMLAILLSAYEEEKIKEGDVRAVLHLKPEIAPVEIAVFPLLKNKPELVVKARAIYDELKKTFRSEFDDNGNVGKRYRRQDEIGTPYCLTVDFDTLGQGEDQSLENTVTVRDRDTMKQERVKIDELKIHLQQNFYNNG